MSLDLRTGRPVWLINRKQIGGHRKLPKNISCEVAIMGGGVSGALLAHNLASLGERAGIVDGRDVGMGSTMARTAILSYESDVHLIDLIAKNRAKASSCRRTNGVGVERDRASDVGGFSGMW
jgi:flavin-dependent dehydrogenase